MTDQETTLITNALIAFHQMDKPDGSLDEPKRTTLRNIAKAVWIRLRHPGPDGRQRPDYLAISDAFSNPAENEPPEAHWLRNEKALENDGEPDGVREDAWMDIAAKVFGPMQFILFLDWAHAGRRSRIQRLIPESGPLTVYQADALLETGRIEALGSGWTDRIVPHDDGLVPEVSFKRWKTLLAAEAELATEKADVFLRNRLERLLSETDAELADGVAAAFDAHVARRCIAALARVCIALRLDAVPVLSLPRGESLPPWERSYLTGLSFLALGFPDTAQPHLEAALSENPNQGALRIALAGLLAGAFPGRSLDMAETCTPTRELLVARAALSARWGQYEAAKALLERSKRPDLASEPARLFWPEGRKQSSRQARALEIALLERSGRWAEAATALAAEDLTDPAPSYIKARVLYQSLRELETLLPHQSWRRSILHEKISRFRHELDHTVLNRDALFFGAMAAGEESPSEAAKRFRRLLGQKKWVAAQQRVGGGRLAYIGDALLKYGDPSDAAKAYRLAAESGHPDMEVRLQVADALAAPVACDSSIPSAPLENPAGFYPALLSAMKHMASGRRDSALACLKLARAQEAPEPVCRFFKQVLEKDSTTAALQESEILQMRLPPRVESVVRLLAGPGSRSERFQRFTETQGNGWPSAFPLDPSASSAAQAAEYCRKGDWERVVEMAEALAVCDDPSLRELGALLRVRHALQIALDGDLDEAERMLEKLAARESGIK